MEQDFADPREKVEPTGAQVLCSVKLARPLKSLGASKAPSLTDHCNCRPFRVAPEGLVFVSVIVWEVGVEPSNCVGKTKTAGDSVIGCWQALVLLSARQMFPESPALLRLTPGQADEFTAYAVPTVDWRTYPSCVELKVTAPRPEPADPPI